MMSEHAGQRERGYALDAILSEQAAAERYRQRQQHARSGRSGIGERARPLEFDESGFPIARRNSSLFRRVARLINPT